MRFRKDILHLAKYIKMERKKNGLTNLAFRAATIVGAALASLKGGDAKANPVIHNDPSLNNIEQTKLGRFKPMPVLRLNINNPENSRFISQHDSHYSHSSHDSHSSHSSHSSHYSGG